MIKKIVFGLATLVTCLALGTDALADPWKDESGHGRGKGKGHYKHEWKKRGGETPDWARGKGFWDGHYKHGRSPQPYWDSYIPYDGGHRHWGDYGYRGHSQPYFGHPQRYLAPYSPYQPGPYPYYSPDPYGESWRFEGSVRIYPQPGW